MKGVIDLALLWMVFLHTQVQYQENLDGFCVHRCRSKITVTATIICLYKKRGHSFQNLYLWMEFLNTSYIGSGSRGHGRWYVSLKQAKYQGHSDYNTSVKNTLQQDLYCRQCSCFHCVLITYGQYTNVSVIFQVEEHAVQIHEASRVFDRMLSR